MSSVHLTESDLTDVNGSRRFQIVVFYATLGTAGVICAAVGMIASVVHLVAQATPAQTGDMVGGWTGAGALTAAGLLALILTWLGAKHLPAKDKQLGEMINAKDTMLKEKDILLAKLVAEKDILLAKTVADKDVAIAEKDKQVERILTQWTLEREKEREARHAIASLYQTGLADVHERYAAEAKAERLANDNRSAAERAAAAREMAEMRALLKEGLAGFRGAVHEIKDTAQTAVTSAALAKAEMKNSSVGT